MSTIRIGYISVAELHNTKISFSIVSSKIVDGFRSRENGV